MAATSANCPDASANWWSRLLVYREWYSTPGKVAFLWCVAGLGFFAALLALGQRSADGVLIEIGGWLGVSLLVPRLVAAPYGIGEYVGMVLGLSLLEEAIAYFTGGGLHGTATSLPEDWVRAVPTFVGLGVGLLVAVRTMGLSSGESFLAAAAAGIVIEIGLGAGFNPIALIALGGAVAWVYGTILALPIRHRRAPEELWVRALGTVALLTVGALVGGFVGLGLQGLLHL
jgi:hypothetical protein